jgi:hypothetical protein
VCTISHGAKPEKSGDAKPPVLTIRKDSGAAMNISMGIIMKLIVKPLVSPEENGSGAAVNISRGVIMKLIISSVFSVLAAPSLAQPFGTGAVTAVPPSKMPQHISSVVYKNASIENKLTGVLSVDQIPGSGDAANTTLKLKFFRTDNLGMTNSSSNMLLRNDRASFTVNAPMPTVNGALSFVGTVYQTPVDSSVARLVQVLSLMATRKINAEFAYSAKINKYSNFNSVIAYRLHPTTDSGKSDVVASFQYGIKL